MHLTKSNTIHDKKNSQGTEIKGEFPQFDKKYLQKPTANIIPNGKKFEVFTLRSRTRQRCLPLSPLLFNIILEVLENAERKENIYRLRRKIVYL